MMIYQSVLNYLANSSFHIISDGTYDYVANGKVRAYNVSRKVYDSIYSMAKTSSGWLTVKCYKLLK